MKIKTNIKDNCFMIIVVILMISFTANIYQAILNKKYCYELGKQNYNKIEEIRLKDLYYPLDTYVGYLTGYVADCPLCGGTLGCTGQNVLTDRITTYQDEVYGTVDIMASSTSLKCGSIVQYELEGKKRTAIVLDRGVVGTNLDLLVDNVDKAYGIGKRYISYDILRFGWSRSNS